MTTSALGLVLSSIALGLAGFILYVAGFAAGTGDPPCFEDEAYIVKVDTNPAHGLTWHCVGLDNLKGE